MRQYLSTSLPRMLQQTVNPYPPLPLLVHAHPKDRVPSGPLEPGMIALEADGYVLHALEAIVQPDGTFGDLPATGFEWARRLCYRHLKREGCLAEFGISIVPAYEFVDLFERFQELAKVR